MLWQKNFDFLEKKSRLALVDEAAFACISFPCLWKRLGSASVTDLP